MSVVFVFQVSDAVSALRRETYFHPKLRERIIAAMQAGVNAHTLIFKEEETKDIVMIRNLQELVGFLAAECDILLHGIYNQEDLDKICNIIRGKLEERRTLVLGNPSALVDVNGKNIIH